MNYKIIIFGLLITVLSIGCGTKKKLIGSWKVVQPEGMKNAEMVIQKDGILELRTTKSTILRNWIYDKSEKALIISEENGRKVDALKVNVIDPIHLSLLGEKEQFELVRLLKVKSLTYHDVYKRLVGKWEISAVDGKKLEGEEIDLTITLFANGTVEEVENDRKRIGNWSLSDDAKHITLSGGGQTETMSILLMSKKGLDLTDKHNTYSFEMIAKAPSRKTNLKIERKLIGEWAVIKVGDESIEKGGVVMSLNANGTVKTFENGQVERTGKWSISGDGKYLILVDSNGEEQFPIESISKKSFKIKDNFKTIVLERQQ
ncbi:MAG: hypothetical protein GY810_27865 [Aureispira sp.]|nr:hypothetical protein [Aureispira sp.]